MVLPLIGAGIGIVARIAATVAKSPTAREGIKKAIDKFGKDVVKKHAGKIPAIVRSSKIAKSAKQGRKSRLKSKASTKPTKMPPGLKTSDFTPRVGRAGAGQKAWKTRQKRIERGEIPDRSSTLGRHGYNPYVMKKGGMVNSRAIAKKYFKGGLV
tara:strand:+ start:261 stop:725 length:465 start_codon:yes stop_codon:yes gene_type:complete